MCAVVVIAIVALIWSHRSDSAASTTPPAAQPAVAQTSIGTASAAKSSRDWSRWADGMASFTSAEFQALLEEALGLDATQGRDAVVSDIIAAWLKADAKGFHKYFMALEVANDLDKLGPVVEALKTALPKVADQIAGSQTLQEVVRRFIAHFARTDPAGALAWATSWLRDDTHDTALVQILGPLAARDASLARNALENVTSPLRRMQALAAVGGNWAKDDATAAAQWATQIAAPTERALAMNSVLLTLASANPGEAATQLAGTAHVLASEYAARYRSDLAALNLTELDVANNTETYRELLADGAVPPPKSSDVELLAEAARVIAGKIAETDPRAAVSWATSLGHDFLELNAMKGTLSSWIERDPPAAVSYYEANYGRYNDLLASLYDVWTGSDSAAAARGIALLQDPAHRSIASQSVARSWAATDAAAAAQWLDQLPITERSDDARLAVATALAATQPVDGWNRAFEITNPNLQYRALKAAFAVLVTTDPDKARGLLQTARLSPTSNARLTEMLHAIE